VQRWKWTILVPAAIGLVTACGSSYTRHDFIARADAICASALRATRAVPPPSFSGTAAQRMSQLGEYLGRVLPVVQAETRQIRALKTPPGTANERAALTSYVRAMGQLEAAYGRLAAAAKRGDADGVASAEAALRANPVASLAASYGLKSCGRPGTTRV
jgi:hypothetical protein